MKTTFLVILLLCATVSFSQSVGVGTTTPNTNAVMDIKSANKGLLIPRMDSVARKNIPNTKGMMVYDTTTSSFWYNTGTVWTQVGAHHFVGEKYGGGTVFWIDANGEHGLVASPADQAATRWYASVPSWTMALGDGPFAGRSNSTIIIANQGYGDGATYAARVTHELSVTQNGITYADWYLPSLSELNLMFQARATIGGFAFVNYWSSTEIDDNLCNSLDFATGQQNIYLKNFTFNIRAIRSF